LVQCWQSSHIIAKKLIEKYIESYAIEEIISANTVKLKLIASMKIHLMVNVSQVVRYRELVIGQKVEKTKLEGIEKWEVEKILNKNKLSYEVFDMTEEIYSRE